MTILEYQSLSLQGQAVVILKKGVMLQSRMRGIKKYVLFQLESFYVEIEYSNLQNKIVNLFSFCSTDYLEPYFADLAEISVDAPTADQYAGS